MALLLKKVNDITVLTNDLKIALELYQTNVKLYLIGGHVQTETASIYGFLSESFLIGFHVDISFIGATSIDRNWDIYTPTTDKVSLKRSMMKSSSRNVLLVDKGKFYKSSFAKICNLSDFDVLITDKKFDADELKRLNVKLIST